MVKRKGYLMKGNLLLVSLLPLLISSSLISNETFSVNTINVAIPDLPLTLNPLMARDGISLRVIRLLFEPLYDYGPEMRYVPVLAYKEPLLLTNVLKVRIKEHLLWSDGTPLTAYDVEFTFKVLKTLNPPHLNESLSYLKSVKAVNEHEVELEVNRRGISLILEKILTLPILQRNQWEPIFRKSLESKNPVEWFSKNWPQPLVSSGPFILESWKGGVIILSKNRFYRLFEGPYIERAVLKVYKGTDDALLGLRRGEVDYIWWYLTPGYAEVLYGDPKMNLVTSPGDYLYYVGFNLRRKPLNDIAFRKAVLELVDKGFIVRNILRDYGKEVCSLVPPWNIEWYSNCSIGEEVSLAMRVRKARDILKEANYTWLGNSLIFKGEREPREIVIVVPSPDAEPILYKVGFALQHWLSKIGVRSKVKLLSLGKFIDTVFKRQEFDIFLYWVDTSFYPDYLRTMFYSKFSGKGMANVFGYKNVLFDSLVERLMGEENRDERKEIVLKMQKLLNKDVPCIPLCMPKLIEVHSGRFVGWVLMPGGIGNKWSFLSIRSSE